MRSHDRSNAHVHRYDRGKGKKPAAPRRVIAGITPKVVSFRVQVDGRSYHVESATFVGALDAGLERSTTTPTHVTLTKEFPVGAR